MRRASGAKDVLLLDFGCDLIYVCLVCENVSATDSSVVHFSILVTLHQIKKW